MYNNINLSNFFNDTKAFFKGCKKPKRHPNYISFEKSRYKYNQLAKNKRFQKDYPSYEVWINSKYNFKISSMYWYGEDKKGKYVIRYSNHWTTYKNFNFSKKISGCGIISTCYWFLKTNIEIFDDFVCGKCYLDNFEKI